MDVFSPSVLTAISRVAQVNGGILTLPVGGQLLMSHDLGLCQTGQIILLSMSYSAVKGGTPGRIALQGLKESGTGTIAWPDTALVGTTEIPGVPAGQGLSDGLTAFGVVTAPGTYVLRFEGFSSGSDSTIGVGLMRLCTLKFNR
jgi:hypothetical protein